MCNIGCKYEGFKGKCIKQLHGIPENIKPKECVKYNRNILIKIQNYREYNTYDNCLKCKNSIIKYNRDENCTCKITSIIIDPIDGICDLFEKKDK